MVCKHQIPLNPDLWSQSWARDSFHQIPATIRTKGRNLPSLSRPKFSRNCVLRVCHPDASISLSRKEISLGSSFRTKIGVRNKLRDSKGDDMGDIWFCVFFQGPRIINQIGATDDCIGLSKGSMRNDTVTLGHPGEAWSYDQCANDISSGNFFRKFRKL